MLSPLQLLVSHDHFLSHRVNLLFSLLLFFDVILTRLEGVLNLIFEGLLRVFELGSLRVLQAVFDGTELLAGQNAWFFEWRACARGFVLSRTSSV